MPKYCVLQWPPGSPTLGYLASDERQHGGAALLAMVAVVLQLHPACRGKHKVLPVEAFRDRGNLPVVK